MKKLLFIALLCCTAMGASAQKNWTVWFGINLANMDLEGQSTEAVAQGLNLGVMYTQPFAEKFDWNAGLSYQTKGYKQKHGGTWSPGLLQLDGSVGWNPIEAGSAKIGLVTGPMLNYIVVKDDAEGINEFGFGWQIGARATFRSFVVGAGYEYNITKTYSDFRSNMNNIYIRLGWRF